MQLIPFVPATPLAASLAVLLTVALVPAPGQTADTQGVEHVAECSRNNIPEPGAVRALRFESRDRVGNKRVTRVRIEGKRAEDGSRRILARFLAPDDMKDALLLMIERDGENEIYFKSPELAEPKRINGPNQTLSLFGTDFTYEDFQNLQQFNRPGLSKRLSDSEVSGRPVWVVETLPAAESGSMYKSLVTFVDKETCIALRVEMFGDDGRARKILNVDPNQIVKRGPVWIAHQAIMKDLRDYTETQLLVETVDVHVEFAEDNFQVGSLRSASAPTPSE